MTHDDLIALFEAWYEEEMPRIFNFITTQVGDRATAEDLTARTCEKALTRLHQYNSRRGAFNAWMFTIARNLVRNHLRDSGRRPGTLPLDACPSIHTDDVPVEAQVAQAEAFKQVVAQMAHLPRREREAVALRYGAGLSPAEVARVMGVSANHASVLLYRALGHLRSALRDEQEEVSA